MGTKKTNGEQAFVVTTEHRGVFFGYTADTSGDVINLRAARCCLRWTSDIKGFMGLASTGPSSSCRVGPAADMQVRKITSVMACTPEAIKAWESAPWSR